MKTLITTTAIGLMLTTPVLAETSTTAQAGASGDQMQVQASAGSDTFLKTIPHSINASGLIGKRVYVSKAKVDASQAAKPGDQNWDDVGEVSDVVLGIDGKVDAVLVDVGGFLGIGEKTVAISMNSLQMVPDGTSSGTYNVVVKGSKAMLNDAPAYSGNGKSPVEDASQTEAMNVNNSADAAASTATDMGNKAADAGAQAMDNTKQAASNAMDNTKQAASDAADKTKQVATDAARATKQAAADTGQAVKNAAGKAGDMTKQAASDTGSAIDNAVDSTAAAVGQAGQAGPDNGTKVDLASVSADSLKGEGVYGPKNDKVGDVSKLVMGSGNSVDGVVIDVGGFLGIGAKPVEVKASDLTIYKNDNSITVHTSLTEEELKQMPKYTG